MPKKEKRLTGPSQWFGAKAEMLDWLLPILEGIEHTTFVDACCGMLSVLLGKKPSPIEVANDIDDDLMLFFKEVRDHGPELALQILFTPYSRMEWEHCRDKLKEGPDIERARKFITVARQSLSGHWGKAWSRVITHCRRGMSSSVSRWLHLPDDILACCARLATVQIESMSVYDLILQYDTVNTLYYIDPPYLIEYSRDIEHYRFNMIVEDHIEMLKVCLNAQGKFVISGYHSSLYDSLLKNWVCKEYEVKCRSNVTTSGKLGSRPTRTEVLWIKDF